MSKGKHTLIVGASEKPDRYAFKALKMLTDFEHPVSAFAVRKGSVLGVDFINEFPASNTVDTVALYINPKIQEQYYADIIALKPKRVIFNPGTENPTFQEKLAENGIASENACTLVLLSTDQY